MCDRYFIHTLCANAKRRFAAGLYWALAGAVITFANPRVFPTGVTLYDPAHAYNSFVLFGTGETGQGQSYLIDMNGNEVHHWPQAGFPSGLLDPTVTGGKLGHVVVQLSTMDLDKTGGVVPGRVALFRNKTIGELDWGGKIVWQWGSEAPGGAARQHHDWYRLLNGNTLVLSNIVHSIPGFTLPNLIDDAIYEVNTKGEIVWKWLASEHLEEFGFTPLELQRVKETKDPDYLHTNSMAALGPNKWFAQGDKPVLLERRFRETWSSVNRITRK